MNFGRVKFFNNDKNFGFILDDDGQEIYFHFNDREFLWTGTKDPYFSGMNKHYDKDTNKWNTHRRPKKDDRLAYNIGFNSKGKKASPWDFGLHYLDIVERISKRGNLPQYRILQQQKMWTSGTEFMPDILWEGDDLEDLLKKYPIKHKGHDPLWGSSHDDGFQTKIWLEKSVLPDDWQECDDPRYEYYKKLQKRNECWRKD